MISKLEIKFKSDFIYVNVCAEDDYQTSMEFFTKLSAACEKYECKNVLVISDSTPLDTMDAYDHAQIISDAGLTLSHRIAWVELNPEAREIDRFIENVLTNRAIINIRLFDDESEAREWLFGD